MAVNPGPAGRTLTPPALTADERARIAEELRPALVRLGAVVTGDLEVAHDLAQDAALALLSRDDVEHPAV